MGQMSVYKCMHEDKKKRDDGANMRIRKAMREWIEDLKTGASSLLSTSSTVNCLTNVSAQYRLLETEEH